MKNSMGIFIGLEGIDGSGKSSILEPLVKELNLMGIKAKAISKRKFDYENERISYYAKTLYNLIWHGREDPHKFVTSEGWLYFHAIWYMILVENEVLPNLDRHDIIVVDGWYHKIYAKYMLKKNFDMNLLDSVMGSIKKCDMVFMLDVDPNITWKRRDHYENNEIGGYDFNIDNVDRKEMYIYYQNKIREKLKLIGQNEKWNIVCTDKLDIASTTSIIANMILEKMRGSYDKKTRE